MTDVYSAVKEITKRELLKLPNVNLVGVGFKNGDPTQKSIVVGVEKKLPVSALTPEELIPSKITLNKANTVQTDVIETGRIEAGFASEKARTDRWRPAPGGVSIGHYQITAGTLGAMVYVAGLPEDYFYPVILSNNHVIANSNDAEIGDPIYQPGPYDGGTENDKIAVLEIFAPILFSESGGICTVAEYYVRFGNFLARTVGSKHRVNSTRVDAQAVNYFDAAFAVPLDKEDIDPQILGIGEITGVEIPFLGMRIVKSGRTTEFTQDKIDLINATVRVSYGGSKIAIFENQLVAGAMSAGGDSGSLVVAAGTAKAVGLLFAGSNTTTIFSPIQPILDYFNVEFKEEQ